MSSGNTVLLLSFLPGCFFFLLFRVSCVLPYLHLSPVKSGFITRVRASKEVQSCGKWPFRVPIYSHLLCSAFASQFLSYLARSTIT